MTQDSQQAITHVLQQDSKVLSTLFDKLKQLKQLNQLLAEYLDAKLVTHCQVANLENGSLIVITDNAIWATQFRFQIPDLLPKLRQHPALYHLKNIACKIRPAQGKRQIPEAEQPRPMPRLSINTAEIILATASSIKHDKLQAVMRRIAEHIK